MYLFVYYFDKLNFGFYYKINILNYILENYIFIILFTFKINNI